MSLTVFEKQVFKELKKIPCGLVTTYSALARAVKKPQAARAVGNALNKNPFAPRVPCHRVVKANGEIGGYAGGVKNKIALLKKEKITVKNGRVFNFKDKLYEFKN